MNTPVSGVRSFVSFVKGSVMTLMTWPEAAIWICTRDVEKVLALGDMSLKSQFDVAMRAYRGSTKAHVRARADRTADLSLSKDGGGEHATIQEALKGIEFAIRAGLLNVWAFARGTAARTVVPIADLTETQWRLLDRNGDPSGFWSEETGGFLWREPMLMQSDIEGLWPAPLTGQRSKVVTAILKAFENEGAKLKKERALEIARGISGYKRRIFADVWQHFPQERKLKRGERGPARHKMAG
jgi:hypothetical protein